ncbi:hypothetical protein OJF2_36220 [Aquisphaera giovannonii]|uniref:Beta-lactamase-inhibitor-like PepSY-like domain-containing protein n=1 Tax=Aquisphaera giovannonii TaxID=406548 RepID=A0A5B9W4A1_9BACT|nr:PepSY-like domain-containing protein [Aquisphaera giovannonii]QEH35077.1 hypothetical protein OJF2_36220 [Aquisphaera giovannonii]
MKTAMLLSLGLLAGAIGSVRADEQRIKMEELPKAVTAAIKDKFPDGRLTKAEKEVEDGKTTYEVTVEAGAKKLDVVASPAGVILAIEKKIDAKNLPEPVAAAIKVRHPTARVKSAEEVVEFKAAGEETVYEVTLGLEGKEVELTVSPKGRILKEEGDEEEDEKPADAPKG